MPAIGSSVRSALLEAAFVVLGVVLALGANEWREARHDRALAEEALASIREELAVNRAAVADARAYHAYLIDTLQTLAQRGAPPPSPRLFHRGFIHPTRFFSTAWAAAVNTDAVSHMPYGDVLAASEVYAQQERYETQAELAGGVIYEQLYAGGTGGITRNYRNLLSLIYTFGVREDELVAAYDAALARLGGPAQEAAAPAAPAAERAAE